MRITLSLPFLCLAGAALAPAQGPVMDKVQPASGTIGTVLRIHGNFLGKDRVDEVYLSDHTFDVKVKVLDQKDDAIEVRVPPFVKPGRLQFVLKTVGKEPLILEQPLFVTIDEPKETVASVATPAPAANDHPTNGTR